METMTKKDFRELTDYHLYGKQNESGVKALFFDWKQNDEGRGFKFVVFARASNATKKDLEDALYKLVFNEEETPWWINCAVAPTDKQRFKVPLVASGLTKLFTHFN